MAKTKNGKTPEAGSRKSAGVKTPAKQPIPINTAASTTQPSSVSMATQANPGMEEEIRRLAYELYEQRGRQDGLDREDWTRAETEILAKHHRGKTA